MPLLSLLSNLHQVKQQEQTANILAQFDVFSVLFWLQLSGKRKRINEKMQNNEVTK